ncbi:MAG TPA: hypothetical protein VNP04_17535 [Alphaproteobacteria bacterium]|nr:hypothetical protein [Alphaproteobacteria bacterium]
MRAQIWPRKSVSVLLLLTVVLVYLANGRVIGSGDTVPARYLPISILKEFDFDLDEFPFLYDETGKTRYPLLGGIPYFLRLVDDHYISAYPPGSALAALPIYLIPVISGMPATSTWVLCLEKLSASLITAISVLFLFWALRELVTERWAVILAVLYAFGTSSFSVSSQALWQHGPSQLFLAASLFLFTRGLREEQYIAYAGFTMASAVVMRPTDVLIALPMGCYVLHKHWKKLPNFVLFAMPPAAFLLAYNYIYFGSILETGYGRPFNPTSFFWQTPFLQGFSGILFSPGRGLFVFSPVLLLSIVGVIHLWIKGPWAFRYLSLGSLFVVLLYSRWFAWWGGWSYGPRLLADLALLLCFFLYPITEMIRRRWFLKLVFAILALLSVGCHALGVFWYDTSWDARNDPDRRPDRLWDWRDSPLVYYGKEALYSTHRVVSHAVIAIRRVPTSQNSLLQLASSYELLSLHPGSVVYAYPYGLLEMSVKAWNTGQAVWLSGVKRNGGTVQLVWRWFSGDQELPATLGSEAIKYDVFPGQDYEFSVRIAPPRIPGIYRLVVGLVSDRLAWFADLGIEPISLAVHVVDPSAEALESLWIDRSTPGNRAVALAIASDQTHSWDEDTLHLTMDVLVFDGPQTVDAYLLMVGPDGSRAFFDGKSLVPYMGRGAAWVPLARGIKLSAGRLSGVSLLSLPLVDMLKGTYTWYLFLTEPNSSMPVAKASTTFTVEP